MYQINYYNMQHITDKPDYSWIGGLGVGGREKQKLVAPKRERESAGPKGKRENTGSLFCDPHP